MRRLMYEAQRSLASPARNPRMATVIGRLLGAAFLICFGTGLYSHFLQQPLPGMRFATRPEFLYQFTEGTHIIAGMACFPLLLAKLYIVFPDLFAYPPVRSFVHLLERASIALFVGASLAQITIGLLNTYQWYPWPFPFRQVHFALAWVLIGSLALHIGIKLPIIARFWRKRADYGPGTDHLTDAVPVERVAGTEADRLWGSSRPTGLTGRLIAYLDATPPAAEKVSRRGFLATVGVAVAAVVGLTAGQTFAPLDAVNVFGPRKKGVGQQGVPVNRTAKQANVTEAVIAGWMLTVAHGGVERSFTRAELERMPQTEVTLPIACVEGWSQMAAWRGVRLRDLADLVGAGEDTSFRLVSLEPRGSFRQTQMGPEYVRDPLTLVALELNGETLDLEHGYPARMIAPGRPGVLQTKWLSRIEAITA
ncbi:molybdopterin-dependent oxidoreductase [Cryobacterium fucosi]|uniref:Twin-arginine translocation signal domain-containing protein n=1 Tax=Cryobacterium fucosi TaxID=1259157 RepID=A0A4R9BHA2_9MICO|nr:molybdopterin-dependent oxidoreductase [Cryobacterium fucosi]TFD82644.1 twin-arginine translocation signal domain-containing protein [Cryobacterium fucosi]